MPRNMPSIIGSLLVASALISGTAAHAAEKKRLCLGVTIEVPSAEEITKMAERVVKVCGPIWRVSPAAAGTCASGSVVNDLRASVTISNECPRDERGNTWPGS